MSPKEKVRANIYKELLMQEKKKNKRISALSVGVFFIGIFALSGLNRINDFNKVNNVATIHNEKTNVNTPNEGVVTPDELSSNIDQYFNSTHDKTIEISPDEFFVFENKI